MTRVGQTIENGRTNQSTRELLKSENWCIRRQRMVSQILRTIPTNERATPMDVGDCHVDLRLANLIVKVKLKSIRCVVIVCVVITSPPLSYGGYTDGVLVNRIRNIHLRAHRRFHLGGRDVSLLLGKYE